MKSTISLFLFIVAVSSGCDQQRASALAETGFQQTNNPLAKKLENDFDLSGLTIPRDEIHTLLSKDGIKSLTDPPIVPVDQALWLNPKDRLLVASVGGESLGVALRMLDRHEIVNLTLGGKPIAITYCPLCDSGAVFSRSVSAPDGTKATLEFGVSGSLYNSNVLMYDQQSKGLWSQLGMRCVSGRFAGQKLESFPVAVMTVAEFKRQHSAGQIVQPQKIEYTPNVYGHYFSTDRLLVPVKRHGDAMAKKTLGIGIASEKGAWFLPKKNISGTKTIKTDLGDVTVEMNDDVLRVTSAPDGIQTAQSFYYAWTAFYPDAKIVQP